MDGNGQQDTRTREELLEENRNLRFALQEAAEANRAKETFLSNMSHDIRTPMNAIIGLTAIAKRYIDEKSRVTDALDKIETAGAHLLNLINDVLDMSRINAGRLQLAEEPFSLSELIHGTLVLIRPQMENRNHNFRLHVGEIPAENLIGDPLRIRQILVNILSNAAKYTEDGGRVDFTVAEEAEGSLCRLLFTCRDNGIGMSEEFLQRIFEPFERVRNSTLSRVEGTGLGMSIVQKITAAMGGAVEVDSRPGEGTEVRIRLPLQIGETAVRTDALRGRRILVAEEQEELRNTLSGILERFGLDYTSAASVQEAFSALSEADLRQHPYSLILIGRVGEDDSRALDLAAHLRDACPGAVPVLIGEEDWPRIEYRANQAGIRHFVPLPVFPNTLVSALNDALAVEAPGGNASACPDLSGRRILVAEDNEINREIILEILSQTRVTTDAAADGQEAVDRFLASPEGFYNLVLMDIQMPVLDGYGAVRAIRSAPRADAKTVQVYAMTANTFAEDVARAREAGMNGHIGKPIDIQALMQVLRKELA